MWMDLACSSGDFSCRRGQPVNDELLAPRPHRHRCHPDFVGDHRVGHPISSHQQQTETTPQRISYLEDTALEQPGEVNRHMRALADSVTDPARERRVSS